MNQKSNMRRSIPSVLFLSEKISIFFHRVLKLRFPWEREFSLRDLAIAFFALILFALFSLVPVSLRIRNLLYGAALVICLIPVVLQAFRLIRKGKTPVEEITVFIAALFAVFLHQLVLAITVVCCSVFIWQIEAYTLLHVESESNTFELLDEKSRNRIRSSDLEKSREHRRIAFSSFAYFVLFVLLFLVMLILALIHISSAAEWIQRAMIVMVFASPAAILFCSLLTHYGAMFSSAKAGAVFRNDQIPEDFAECKIFAFSKTGTVTDGNYQITEIVPVGIGEDELLRIAAVAECRSNHPIAAAIKKAAGLKEGVVPSGVLDVTEIPGKGVSTFFSGRQIYVGNASLLEDHDIWYRVPSKSGTAIHVAVDSTYRGYLLISDAVRDHAFEALEELRAHGAERLVMLTGDVPSVSRVIASSLNFDMVKSQLTSEEKASAINFLRSTEGDRARVAAVGDGKHDAAMFQSSDVSVSFDQKPDDEVDLRIVSDDILCLPLVYHICRDTQRTLKISALGLAAVKLLFCILGVSKVLSPVVLVILQFAIEAGAVVFALTCLTLERRGLQG